MGVNAKMTAIADAIRDKTKGTEPLTLDGMATEIPKVYEEGKQAEYDRFWDAYQENGARVDYTNGFAGRGWTTETFKPKYDIRPTAAYMMFRQSNMAIDLVEYLDTIGITLDFSKCLQLQYAFYGSRFTRIGIVDMRSVLYPSTAINVFDESKSLKTIDLLIVKETLRMNIFNNCPALENLTIEGTIGTDINLQWSTKLTHDSLMSVINALKDYSEDTSGTVRTITLGAENLAKLSTEEIKIIDKKGWQYG